MLEFCVKQNVFLYAMIAAGIAGVWCLFWNNRFYTRAIRDLGRLKEPKSKWTRSVLETCQRKAHPFSNAGAFMRSQIAQGRSAGMAVPTLLRGSQNMILTVLALSILSLWAIYRYRYGEAELMRYLGTGIALAGCLVFFRLCLDFGGKEEILLNGWTDYLENEFAATKQSAVLETVQQTERQPYNIPKAQLVIADIPYNIGIDAYASSPEWYKGGDNRSGESKSADCGKRVRQREE